MYACVIRVYDVSLSVTYLFVLCLLIVNSVREKEKDELEICRIKDTRVKVKLV